MTVLERKKKKDKEKMRVDLSFRERERGEMILDLRERERGEMKLRRSCARFTNEKKNETEFFQFLSEALIHLNPRSGVHNYFSFMISLMIS